MNRAGLAVAWCFLSAACAGVPGSASSSSSGNTGASSSSSSGGIPDAGGPPPVECVAPGALDIFSPLGDALEVPRDTGHVLGCVTARSFTQAGLQAMDVVGPLGHTAAQGGDEFIIQYVSRGPATVARRVTALLMFPDGPGPFPLVAFAHGTSGMGPACGVTRDRTYSDYVALPLVARGYAVVATDYANLGVPDGVHPYAVGEGEAFNVLDSILAARQVDAALHDVPVLSDELFIAGHSQGGHAALFAHQYFREDEIGMRLLGSVPFAPAFGAAYGLGPLLGDGNRRSDGVTVFSLMMLLAHGAYLGLDPDTWLQLDPAAQLEGIANDTCYSGFATQVTSTWTTHGALFRNAFRTAAATCMFDGQPCPDFQPWADAIYASAPGWFSSTAPVLMLQGEQDTSVAPITVACIHAALSNHGTPVQTCAYATDNHINIVLNRMGLVMDWMDARRRGESPTACTRMLAMNCAL